MFLIYRNNERLLQVNAKSNLNLFHFSFYEVKQVWWTLTADTIQRDKHRKSA